MPAPEEIDEDAPITTEPKGKYIDAIGDDGAEAS